jgi:Zn-dependent protease with chaperone function
LRQNESVETAEQPLTSQEIRVAFRRPIDRIPVTRAYRIRLFAVLVGLAALQFLYLVLIAAIAGLTVLYGFAGIGLLTNANFITVVLYLGPPAAGLIAILFLLKPLIVRPPRPPQPIRLVPANEPVLFEFVEALCRALGSPVPSRIYADLQANASAGVRGWKGFFAGDLNLTIGLPLATGLTLSQFAGVLAHEFGHFSQRAGMRSYFLIQTIQNWFARVVYQRDRWDEWLSRRREHGDWRMRGVALLAGVVVAGSRKYLALLMKAGNWIASAFSRHMEFDADRYEGALVGADVFEQTSLRLPLLITGATAAWQDAAKDWSVGRLPENVAALSAARTECLPGEVAAQIVDQVLGQQTGKRDTHPCTAERIASVRRDGREGVLHLDGPASRLFRDLPALGREATLHHYEAVLKLPAGTAQLVPAAEALVNTQAVREHERAVWQLFNSPPEFCCRWFELPPGEPREHESAGHGAGAPAIELKTAPFESAFDMSMLHFAALTIKQAGRSVKPESFRLNAADLQSIREEESLSTHNLTEAIAEYNQQTKSVAERIETTTARLLKGELGVAVRQDLGLPIPDLVAAWHSYGALSGRRAGLLDIRRRMCALRIVRQNARLFPAADCANLIDRLEAEVLTGMEDIVEGTAAVPASVIFDGRAAATLGAQLTVAKESKTERIETFMARVDTTAARALSHLAWYTVSACPPPQGGPAACLVTPGD